MYLLLFYYLFSSVKYCVIFSTTGCFLGFFIMNKIQFASPFGDDADKRYMRVALQEAQEAFLKGEIPIGAVVVDAEGDILARAHNTTEHDSTQAAHAEVRALQKTGQQKNNWRLEGCWLFCTLEPCSMCFHLAVLSRCEGIVFGAASPLFGFRLDKTSLSQVYKEDVLSCIEGVCAQEAAYLLKKFFKKRRDQGERSTKRSNP